MDGRVAPVFQLELVWEPRTDGDLPRGSRRYIRKTLRLPDPGSVSLGRTPTGWFPASLRLENTVQLEGEVRGFWVLRDQTL